MTKNERLLAETKYNLVLREREVRDMKSALEAAVASLKWARDTLIEKEEENRRLKLVILQLTGGKSDDADSR